MSKVIKLIPWLIIAYTFWQGYLIYEEFSSKKTSLQEQISLIKRKINKSKARRRNIKSYRKDVASAKSNIGKITKALEDIQKKLPQQKDDAKIFEFFRNLASGLLIKDVSFSPSIENNKGFYIEKNYNFSAKGTYLQFLLFFEKIARTERLFNIKNVSFTRFKTKKQGYFQTINAAVSIESYRYNPDHKEKSGIESIESEFNKK